MFYILCFTFSMMFGIHASIVVLKRVAYENRRQLKEKCWTIHYLFCDKVPKSMERIFLWKLIKKKLPYLIHRNQRQRY